MLEKEYSNHMSFESLSTLRKIHPSWRLLASQQAPFVISFLYFTFLQKKQREISEEQLALYLEDYMYSIQYTEKESYSSREILTQWSNDEYAWLRKYYPRGRDEVHYDLTPTAQKAIEWLLGFQQQNFIATESRLITVFQLLQEIIEKSDKNPEYRIQELEKQKEEIEKEIGEIRKGKIKILNSVQIKDRFLQAMNVSHEILADFRQVEQNLRELDQKFRTRIV